MMTQNIFSHHAPTPSEHFKLWFYAAVLALLERVLNTFDSPQAAFERFPFLVGYNNELAKAGLDGLSSSEAVTWWLASLRTWEKDASVHLPLRALRDAAGLDDSALLLLLTIGLSEEDARFGLVLEALQGIPGQHRPTAHWLNAWTREENEFGSARVQLSRLQEWGLVRVTNSDAPRIEWTLEIPGALWDALRGEEPRTLAPGVHYHPSNELPELSHLVLADEIRATVERLPALLDSRQAQAVIVRGAQHNGRRTLLRALARARGRGVIEINGATNPTLPFGALATTLHALPIYVLDLAPQETVELASLPAYDDALGVVIGKHGGVKGAGVERALTLNLALPEVSTRRRLWQSARAENTIDDADAFAERFRLTSGNIYRAARLAESYAALENRATITLRDVHQATRALNSQTLDILANRLDAFGDWSELAISSETQRELENLVRLCRHREHLRAAVGETLSAQLSAGVRALFSGPSGTGKTLAARVLAASLQKDIYRLDLAAVVNKYIGETEKNLNQIFSRAEELDVILLLDEGDALLTQRTSVQTSNDRYANLETNFLLQRLETFEGILIVTTNAAERIDGAFQRRMDLVVTFNLPDAEERWAIWQMHLPRAHAIHSAFMEQVAQRCVLSGGQIRNAALHAALLALDDGGVVNSFHLEAAVQREYRKAGAVCPLRATREFDFR